MASLREHHIFLPCPEFGVLKQKAFCFLSNPVHVARNSTLGNSAALHAPPLSVHHEYGFLQAGFRKSFFMRPHMAATRSARLRRDCRAAANSKIETLEEDHAQKTKTFVESSALNGGAYVSSEPFSPEVAAAAEALRGDFAHVDLLVAANMSRVLKAYANARVGSHHFAGSTGYGHADGGGREALDSAFAEIAGAEAACVRSQFFSGTHAIACALYAVLRPGDELVAIAGAPYDTMEEVIGLRGTPGHGSLREFGVSYREVPLADDGGLDWAAVGAAVRPETRCALVQRSCGYSSFRRTLTIPDIERAVGLIKAQNPDCVIVVDNCYGEFVDVREPTAVGADLMAGSLIKNPGGTIAPAGGYVAGRAEWVAAAAARLSAPGIGMDAGATPGSTMRLLLQGLFLGPQMVGEAIKSSLLVAEVMSAQGYKVQPPPRVRRHDIIQAVELGSRARLLAFCGAVQTRCPVGAYIRPEAGATAGYESEVVFADGTFIDGSTIELSCDGPLREPFAVFCQGGTHWTHWALALDAATAALRSLEA